MSARAKRPSSRAVEDAANTKGPAAPGPPPARKFDEGDRARALAEVARCGGNLTRASRRLGIHVSVLHRWQKRARDRAP